MTGTNALSISATARDAEIAQALAVAAGVETIAYVKAGDEPYDLVLLDAPELPSSPANSKKSLTVAIGALLGLMLGLAIATMVDRADSLKRSSRRRDVDTDPTDPAQVRALSAASESEVSVVVEATSDPRVHRDIAEALDRGSHVQLGCPEDRAGGRQPATATAVATATAAAPATERCCATMPSRTDARSRTSVTGCSPSCSRTWARRMPTSCWATG